MAFSLVHLRWLRVLSAMVYLIGKQFKILIPIQILASLCYGSMTSLDYITIQTSKLSSFLYS